MEDPKKAPAFLSAMAWVTGLRVVGLPLQFGVFLLVARLYDLSDVGVYAVANAIWQAFKGLGPLGLDVAGMRFVPVLLAEGRAADAQALERSCQGAVLIVNLVAAGLLAAVAHLLLPTTIATGAASIVIVAAGVPVFALLGLQVAQLRARNLVKAAQVPESILLHALAALLIGFGVVVGGRSITWALAGTVGSAAIVVGINHARFHRLHTTVKASLKPALRREITSAAVHMFSGQALATAGARVCPIVISAIMGAAAAGLFEAATRLGQLASVTTWAAGVAAAPQMAEAHAAGDRSGLQRTVTASSWAAFLPALGVLVLVASLGKMFLLMFGSPFVDAYPVAVLVSLATAVNAGAGLSATALYMTGRERLVLYLTATSVVLLVGLLLALVPTMGLAGAGIALIAAALVRDGGASAALPTSLGIVPGVLSFAGSAVFARRTAHTFNTAFRRKR